MARKHCVQVQRQSCRAAVCACVLTEAAGLVSYIIQVREARFIGVPMFQAPNIENKIMQVPLCTLRQSIKSLLIFFENEFFVLPR